MKHTLLLILIVSLCGHLTAQNNSWNVFLRGQAVKSIDFDSDNVWAATDSFLVKLNKHDKSATSYSYPYTDKNGSSYHLKIDNDGVIWIARSENLQSGSSIYESYNSTIYSFDENHWNLVKSIGYGAIYSLAIDKHNNKWIAAMGNNGLYRIHQDSCVQLTPENSGYDFEYVAQVATDNDGNTWVANCSNLGGLLSADITLMKNDGDQWTLYSCGRGIYFLSICFDSQGNPWVQNLLSVKKLDIVSNSWSEQMTLDLDKPRGLLAIEGENRLWFKSVLNSKDNGIAVCEDSNWSYYTSSDSELPSNTINQIAIDSNETKWIATENGLAALDLATSIWPISNLNQKFELYPNPAHDYIALKMPKQVQNSIVEIINISGQVLQSYKVNNNQTRLDVSQIPAGVYLLRIQTQNNQSLRKFVKQ